MGNPALSVGYWPPFSIRMPRVPARPGETGADCRLRFLACRPGTEGTGDYFLDRTSPGVWVLHVYPDAVWVNDPFGPDSLHREVPRVY